MNKKVSLIVTAWKEDKTIAQCIDSITGVNSGINNNFELILACPDDATYNAALEEVKKLKIEDKFVFVKDPGKGKPAALNMILQKATGDILIFTDGDVYFKEGSVAKLVSHFENDNSLKAVTGRPVSNDERNNMMGYFGHLLSDAAHHKRTIDLTENPQGKGRTFVKKRNFFTVSGYIYAISKFHIEFPSDCLVDDGFLSYVLHNDGGKIEYEPEAIAYVKYPKNLADYFKQKKRSTGGFLQLWEYGVVRPETKTRSFWRELEYFWFPIAYAKNLRELFWSFLLYPIRLWLWVMIYFERKVLKKDFVKTWTRIESTK
jgi:cellulose synthase/poly-beta-1,6-N-acetylglucosamine synthase-like glycosyltransferase